MSTWMLVAATLRIIVSDSVGVPNPVLGRAQREADRILRSAGVRTEWFECTPDEFRSGRCETARRGCFLEVHVLPTSEAGRWPVDREAFGFALPAPAPEFGVYAGVFYDPVRELAAEAGSPAALVLGHIVAHEIGHLLLTTRGHSAGGLMKGRWLKRELGRMQQGTLLFHGDEARQIRWSVAERARECAGRRQAILKAPGLGSGTE